ncbi:hypothetical protein Tco_1214677 [Tanacetum coccineum]
MALEIVLGDDLKDAQALQCQIRVKEQGSIQEVNITSILHEGNAEFHEVIAFLARSSIHHALTLVNVPVPLDHFPVNALTSKVFSFMVKKGKHFSGKVTPLFASMLVQSTEDEGATSERPSEP